VNTRSGILLKGGQLRMRKWVRRRLAYDSERYGKEGEEEGRFGGERHDCYVVVEARIAGGGSLLYIWF